MCFYFNFIILFFFNVIILNVRGRYVFGFDFFVELFCCLDCFVFCIFINFTYIVFDRIIVVFVDRIFWFLNIKCMMFLLNLIFVFYF